MTSLNPNPAKPKDEKHSTLNYPLVSPTTRYQRQTTPQPMVKKEEALTVPAEPYPKTSQNGGTNH